MGKRKKRNTRKRRKALTARAKADARAGRSGSADEAPEATEGDSDDEAGESSPSDDDVSAESSDDEDSASDSGTEPPDSDDDAPASSEPPPRPEGREFPGWVHKVVAFERRWSWLESRLLFIALIVLMLVLCVWISLNGMSSPLATPNKAGVVFRALVGAVLLGGLTRLAIRKRPMARWKRSVATAVAAIIGLAVAPLWREVGIDYFGGWLDWLQEGSTVTLLGGLRGLGTRLTILVALLGGSLAAASARHINIDVVVRFLKPRLRLPVAVLGGIATAVVCFVASWGLLDYLAIDGFHAEREATPSAKVAHIQDELGEQFFILRKQLGLDVRALPTVIAGTRWDDESRLDGHQWNEWVESSGFREHYTKEQVDRMLAPDDALDESRLPFVVVPDGSPRIMLVPAMDLTYPFGFLMIGLRVLLRLVLLLAGFVLPFQAGGDEEYGYEASDEDDADRSTADERAAEDKETGAAEDADEEESARDRQTEPDEDADREEEVS